MFARLVDNARGLYFVVFSDRADEIAEFGRIPHRRASFWFDRLVSFISSLRVHSLFLFLTRTRSFRVLDEDNSQFVDSRLSDR